MTVDELQKFLEHKDPSAEVVALQVFRTEHGWDPTGEDMPVLFAEGSDEIRLCVGEAS